MGGGSGGGGGGGGEAFLRIWGSRVVAGREGAVRALFGKQYGQAVWKRDWQSNSRYEVLQRTTWECEVEKGHA